MLLREDLLSDRTVALARAVPAHLDRALVSLGARVHAVPGDGSDLEAWAAARAPLHGAVYDARPSFGAGGEAALDAGLEGAWEFVRAVAVGALIPSAVDGGRKIVLVAPPVAAGPLAAAAGAGLESLARTVAVEWARYSITAVAVVPGPASNEDQLVQLIGFLLSPAGDYFSGCRFDLGSLPLPLP